MGKILAAVLILVFAYFAFLKRKEPPKEVHVAEQEVEQIAVTHHSVVSATGAVSAAAGVASTTAMTGVDSAGGDEGSLSEDADTQGTINEKDEPKENVDQTIIGNEKRLEASKSAQEVFELLRKLRIRPKKLGEISAPAKDLSGFWGSYEGSALNNRNEVIYGLKIDLTAPGDGSKANVVGGYQLSKTGSAPVKSNFPADSAVQLVGRDSIVLSTADGQSYFQMYKLENGYLAGNFYEKSTRRMRTYRFVLKNK